MNSNNADSAEVLPKHRRIRRQVPLRMFVVGAVAVAMAAFAWSRTGGDYLISALLAALTAAVIDIRVGDSGLHER